MLFSHMLLQITIHHLCSWARENVFWTSKNFNWPNQACRKILLVKSFNVFMQFEAFLPKLIDCRIVKSPAAWQEAVFSHLWVLQHIRVKHMERFFKDDISIVPSSLCRSCWWHSSPCHDNALSTHSECGSIARLRSSDWSPTKCSPTMLLLCL